MMESTSTDCVHGTGVTMFNKVYTMLIKNSVKIKL